MCALVIVAGVVTLAVGAAAAQAPRAAAIVPRLERLGQTPVFRVRDRVIRGRRAPAAAPIAAAHGGIYTAATGDQVKVYVSNSYPIDDTVNQRWADFIAGLVHGTEIATVTIYVAPIAEVQSICQSTEADGCYLLRDQQIIVPGEPLMDGVPVEEIVAHEYGHHIAMNRSNGPWPAVDWGTKRWASYENVCKRVQAHTAFPGDEGANYFRNPGEAFAESYRVLNDQRAPLGSVQLPWRMDGFAPDPTALAMIEQDVRKPWTGTYISRWGGRVDPRSLRRLVVPTPHDGIARFVLKGPSNSAIAVLDPVTGRPLGAARLEIRYGICGERHLNLAVGALRAGKFSVTIARP